MYVKLSPRDLNLNHYSPHPTSTYTCEWPLHQECVVVILSYLILLIPFHFYELLNMG